MPAELLLTIADNLPTASLSRFLRTTQSLHIFLTPVLTKRISTEHLGRSILKSGITHNHLPTVHLALAHSARWHSKPKRGPCYNALKAACDAGHLAIVAALMSHYGPSMLTRLRCHANPFVTAVKTANVPLLTVLLEHGAPPDFVNRHSQSALDIAAIYGCVEITEVLIAHGAPVWDARNSLSYAMYYGNWDVVRVLLRAGLCDLEWCEDGVPRLPVGYRSEEVIEAWIEGKVDDVARYREAEEATGTTGHMHFLDQRRRFMWMFL